MPRRKRKDQCFCCSSRKCKHRVISTSDNGKSYDQIACDKHWKFLLRHAERCYDGKVTYMETTGRFTRGERDGE